jgi:hypothetical protein
MRKFLSLTSLFIAASACAEKIEIRFETADEREVWVLAEVPMRLPAAGRAFNAKSIPVEFEGASQVIVVHEPKTSSVAVKQAGDITGAWTVSAKEWKAAEVKVQAFRSGTPLDKGKISLHSPSYTKTLPIEDGGASFFAVPYGEVEVRVDANGGGMPPSAPQVFRIRKDVPAAERTIGVTVVADPSKETGPQPKAAQPVAQQPEAPWYSRLAIWLVSAAVATVGLVFLMRFLKVRSDQVEEKLRGLGVPVPSDLATPQADDEPPASKPFQSQPVVPEGHCPYCGKETADCICRLDAPKASPGMREPEFVGAGVELRIPAGESIVGREGDLAIVDPTVSRQHAKVVREAGVITVEDLGSSNGTYVDGTRIESPTELRPGATVYFGTVKVRLEA